MTQSSEIGLEGALGLVSCEPFASAARVILSRAAAPQSHGSVICNLHSRILLQRSISLQGRTIKLITHIVIRYRQRRENSAGCMWGDQAPEEAKTASRVFLPLGNRAEEIRSGQICARPRHVTPVFIQNDTPH